MAETCFDLDLPTTCILCTEDPMLPMLEGMLDEVKRPEWQMKKIGEGPLPVPGKEARIRGDYRRMLGFGIAA